jgi:hypothetical protein
MFLFRPSPKLWADMLDFFNTTPLLSDMMFPDQDFLAEFFRDRWLPMGWQYNALKTMRYWHENIWRDDEVVVLHYIVDKPWAKRNTPEGKGGYLGNDGETHSWWWADYEEWVRSRGDGSEVVRLLSPLVNGGADKQKGGAQANGAGRCADEAAEEAKVGGVGDARPLGI